MTTMRSGTNSGKSKGVILKKLPSGGSEGKYDYPSNLPNLLRNLPKTNVDTDQSCSMVEGGLAGTL